MKTIGMIGGMSWESTEVYYRLLNETVKQRLGGLHSARCVLHSVDFGEIEPLMRKEDWEGVAAPLIDAAASLGCTADLILICTNTMHKLYHILQEAVDVPILHIADATGRAIQQKGLRRVALLGTRFVMAEEFYTGRLSEKFGIEAIVPDGPDMDTVHRVIFEELCRGEIKDGSRQAYVNIIQDLAGSGAEGVILGCTEIGLLVSQADVDIPLFDTTALHARAAVDFALA